MGCVTPHRVLRTHDGDGMGWSKVMGGSPSDLTSGMAKLLGPAQRARRASFSAIRSLTICFTSFAGRGLSTGNRIVPSDIS